MRRIGLVVALAVSLTDASCAVKAPPIGQQSPQTLDDQLIVPGDRIGRLRLASNLRDINQRFGASLSRGPGLWPGTTLHTWDSIGLWIVADNTTGNILWISVDLSGSGVWSQHVTREGLRLGASEAAVLAALGPPPRTETSPSAKSFYYDQHGIRFTFPTEGPRSGTVSALRVVWRVAPAGDTLIVPGERISGVKLGMPIGQAVTDLGGGYSRVQLPDGVDGYLWPSRGLRVRSAFGSVTSVGAVPGDFDHAGLRYLTAEGLGLGSNAAQVTAIFGEPSERSPTNSGEVWFYRSRGIIFGLTRQSRVSLMEIFAMAADNQTVPQTEAPK